MLLPSRLGVTQCEIHPAMEAGNVYICNQHLMLASLTATETPMVEAKLDPSFHITNLPNFTD